MGSPFYWEKHLEQELGVAGLGVRSCWLGDTAGIQTCVCDTEKLCSTTGFVSHEPKKGLSCGQSGPCPLIQVQ